MRKRLGIRWKLLVRIAYIAGATHLFQSLPPHPEQIDSCSASASCSERVTLSPYAFLTAI